MMPVRRSQNWLPSIFNDFFGNEWTEKTSSTAPAVNIMETPQEYKVEVAAAGLTKDDFKININDENQLVVTMEKQQENDDKDEKGTYLRREFSYSSFTQSMILPDDVNKDDISARVDNGVLTIEIPKISPEEKQKAARQIEIQGPSDSQQEGRRSRTRQGSMNVTHEGQQTQSRSRQQEQGGHNGQSGQQERQPEYAHEGQQNR